MLMPTEAAHGQVSSTNRCPRGSEPVNSMKNSKNKFSSKKYGSISSHVFEENLKRKRMISRSSPPIAVSVRLFNCTLKRLSHSSHWMWVALDPVSKLLLTIDVGDRTLAVAQGVVHQVVQVLAPSCVPLFLTDGFKEYATALLTHFGQWVQPPRRQATGPVPKPRWMPLPQLLYAQVIKVTRRRRLVRVRHRVVFGTLAAVEQVLAAQSWHINTAFIERINLTIRQHVAAVGRRVMTLCKGEEGLRQQLALYHTYYNFCLPHASLRLPLPQPLPTNGTGSAKTWRLRTPAMAAGLTDRVWTLREVLLYRVPPWPQPHTL